ncbi:uncharacterized protein B0H64DRAFT_372689 [Chaetomium fimeti]|uniref:Fungal N-terminal domain-containing protein n=1 Tax=Chaetomium fimeti TaxID=1854472 RepID=A0AAE0LTU3_9PEZI|nr:hypothetical protein B0H64DRAFT_372689 [Chaetomium fimeti]
MAELIAIAGGIAAIVQLAGTGRRLCKILHQFATDAGAAGVEVRRFANQVRTFSDSIELAERTLFIYCRDHRTSRLVADMEERNILANIDYEAETVRAHLRAIRDRVLNMKSRSVLWATIKWRFNKASILELSPEMESVKTNLNLIIATTQFEALTTVVDAGIASNSEEPNGELQTQM